MPKTPTGPTSYGPNYTGHFPTTTCPQPEAYRQGGADYTVKEDGTTQDTE